MADIKIVDIDCDGDRGERGHRGHRGHDGATGPTGPTGPGSTTGPTGPTGATGATGLPAIRALVFPNGAIQFQEPPGSIGVVHSGTGVYNVTILAAGYDVTTNTSVAIQTIQTSETVTINAANLIDGQHFSAFFFDTASGSIDSAFWLTLTRD